MYSKIWVCLLVLAGIIPSHLALANDLSAFKSRTKYEQLNIQAIQAWESYEQVEKYFFLLRDTRFIKDPRIEGFKRRISWMLPDFGCDARAAIGVEFLKTFKELPLPNKIFIFDNTNENKLVAKTAFSLWGDVEWVDHVSLAVRVKNEVYVLDPSIELSRPLKLVEWIAAMTDSPENVSFSICNPNTFDFSKSCSQPEIELQKAKAQHNRSLVLERKRVKKLGLDPDLVLADAPPWSK